MSKPEDTMQKYPFPVFKTKYNLNTMEETYQFKLKGEK